MATADAYLTLVAAQETVRAAQAGVDRADVVLRTIQALVDAQLRPGADASRAEAELAAARTQLIQAQQAAEVARATLSQFVGMEPAQIVVSAPRLLQLPPERAVAPPEYRGESGCGGTERRRRTGPGPTAERSNGPTFRTSTCRPRRTRAGRERRPTENGSGALNGLAPSVQNYALGFSVTFPVFDLPAIEAREAAQSATIRAQVGAVAADCG